VDPARATTCSGRSDDQVVTAVSIQVGQDNGRSKLIARGTLAAPGSLLGHDRAWSSGEPQIQLPGIAIAPRHTDDQVGFAITVDVTENRDTGLAVGLGSGCRVDGRQRCHRGSRN
jgi:hypothetical protein